MATLRVLADRVTDYGHLRSPSRTGDAEDLVNQAYFEIVARLKLYQKSATITLTANVATYSIIDGFLITDLVDIQHLTRTQAGTGYQPAPLEPVTLEDLVAMREQSVSGVGLASYYALGGLDTFHLYPTPTTADTLTIYYSARPAPLAGPGSIPTRIPEEFHDLIVTIALSRAARLSEPERAMQYDQVAQRDLVRLAGWLQRRSGFASPRLRAQYPGRRIRAYHTNDVYVSGD